MIDKSIKPCPFCGGEGVLQEHLFHGYSSTYGVVCFDCCAETKQFFKTKEEAITAWNSRDKKLPRSKGQNKWIAISDRLPEMSLDSEHTDTDGSTVRTYGSDTVMACTADSEIYIGIFACCNSAPPVFLSDSSSQQDFKLNEVSAWMPLPEPYKE